jgi:endonuclease/exonuclease/phosphatase family metal-dependent hydrolase
MLGEVVRAAAPDLIGFQEVRALKSAPASHAHTGNRWQVTDLARLFPGMEYAYEAAMGFREGRGEFVHEGLAVFSRWPVSLTDAVRLSRDGQDGEDFHQRLCLRARVGTPWGPVNFLTTHLSLSRGARLRTLPEVGAVANALLPEPSLVVGDFNAPYSEGPHVLSAEPFRFRDAWQKVHGKDEGKDELARRRGFTFHSWDHRSRIDFVFYNSRLEQGGDSSDDDGGGHPTIPSLHPTSIEVLGSEGRSIAHAPLPAVGGVEDMRDTLFPSDHLFLAAKFRVTHNRAHAATTATAAHPTAAASSTAVSGVAAPGELKDEL